MRSKTCFKCGRSLPVESFYRHPMMADGRLGKCKDCTRRDVATHRYANRARILEYDRNRNCGARAERSRAAVDAWSSAHPEARRAHRKVARALRSGAIVRGPCVECGEPKTVAHHDDYAKPLDVVWLCDPCHKSRHAALRGKTPWRFEFAK